MTKVKKKVDIGTQLLASVREMKAGLRGRTQIAVNPLVRQKP